MPTLVAPTTESIESLLSKRDTLQAQIKSDIESSNGFFALYERETDKTVKESFFYRVLFDINKAQEATDKINSVQFKLEALVSPEQMAEPALKSKVYTEQMSLKELSYPLFWGKINRWVKFAQLGILFAVVFGVAGFYLEKFVGINFFGLYCFAIPMMFVSLGYHLRGKYLRFFLNSNLKSVRPK